MDKPECFGKEYKKRKECSTCKYKGDCELKTRELPWDFPP